MTYFADCCVDWMCSEMMLYVEHEHCKSSGSSGFSHFIEKKKRPSGSLFITHAAVVPLRFAFSCFSVIVL